MPVVNDADSERIVEWGRTQTTDSRVTLVLTGHEKDPGMEAFCRALAEAVPRVTVKTDRKGEQGIPVIRLSPSLEFSVIPSGRELPPFLEAMVVAAGAPLSVPDSVRDGIASMEIPVDLTLYIAIACPHCPGMLQSLLPLAALGDRIRLHVIDGTLFPDEARKAGILSVPTLVLDNGARWTGAVSLEELTDAMVGRDPSALSPASFKRILEEGRASWIARQMQEKQMVFHGFMDLLVHGLWSVRLGAMVVLEELADTSPGLGAAIVPFLMEKFHGADPTVKGDIFYALGIVGDSGVKDIIRSLMDSLDSDDLKEAAQDAVDAIDSRSQGCDHPSGI